MAVAIRLKRLGRKHRPFYRIEAMEKRNARNGRSLENLGYYDPMVEDPMRRVVMKVDRVQHWLDRGARPSETVTSFLRMLAPDVLTGCTNWNRPGDGTAPTTPSLWPT